MVARSPKKGDAMQLIFLDEFGYRKNWKEKESLETCPFHVLGGILINCQNYLTAIKPPFHEGLKINPIEIVEGTGQRGNNEAERNSIHNWILGFPNENNGTSFLVVIDKKKHLNRRPNPYDPHKIAFQYMFERLQWKLNELQDEAICVYDQNKSLDDELHKDSIALIRNGSLINRFDEQNGHVSKTLKIDKIKEFYLGKSENSLGLQAANFTSIFSYHYFQTGKPNNCEWWNTLVNNLYAKNGTYDGYGLKVFPSSQE
jgi:hypothetical protein